MILWLVLHPWPGSPLAPYSAWTGNLIPWLCVFFLGLATFHLGLRL
jgi:hypothetical protein